MKFRRPSREGHIYTVDFAFVVLTEKVSRWQRAKVWLLMRLGLFRPRT